MEPSILQVWQDTHYGSCTHFGTPHQKRSVGYRTDITVNPPGILGEASDCENYFIQEARVTILRLPQGVRKYGSERFSGSLPYLLNLRDDIVDNHRQLHTSGGLDVYDIE